MKVLNNHLHGNELKLCTLYRTRSTRKTLIIADKKGTTRSTVLIRKEHNVYLKYIVKNQRTLTTRIFVDLLNHRRHRVFTQEFIIVRKAYTYFKNVLVFRVCRQWSVVYSYISFKSALARLVKNVPILFVRCVNIFSPFSAVALWGFPTPVSAVTSRHSRCAHAHCS